MTRIDPHSHFDDAQPRTRSWHLRLRADADSGLLEGEATLVFPGKGAVGTLDLDTQGLAIHRVYVTATAAVLPFELGEEEPTLGRRLRLVLPPNTMGITIAYETAPAALDLRCLSREHPHPLPMGPRQARELVPCQDSAGAPVSCDAEISVPDGSGWRACRFRMAPAAPSYHGLLQGMAGAVRGKDGK